MSTNHVHQSLAQRVTTQFRSHPTHSDPLAHLKHLIHLEAPLLPPSETDLLVHQLSSQLFGLGAIQDLLDDPAVDDVLINGANEVWADRNGSLERVDMAASIEDLYRYVERLVTPLGLQADRSHPIVDARLDDGTRVSVVLPPVALDGPVLAFRRHRSGTIPLTAFCPPDVAGDLIGRLRIGQNIVVYGPTGSGKTTVSQGLLASLDPGLRIVLVEDTAEIQLPDQHVVRLEARPGAADGTGRIELRDLVRTALRLRPDRLVIGEVRGPEALDLLWALTTGHRGSVSTCHAHSGPGAVKRLALLAARDPQSGPMAIVMEQAYEAVDVVVGVQRMTNGKRVITTIEEVRHIRDDRYEFVTIYQHSPQPKVELGNEGVLDNGFETTDTFEDHDYR